MKNNKLLSSFNDIYLNPFLYIAFLMLIYSPGNAQLEFDNSDFESDKACDPDDCELTDIDCISGWWNHITPSNLNDYAWIYYDDYFLCSTENLALNSCGGERGMRIHSGTGGDDEIQPTTENRFKGKNKNASYEIHLLLNVIHNDCGNVTVEVYGDDFDTQQTPATEIFLGQAEGTYSENVCYEIKIPITDPEKVEQLTESNYLVFKINGDCGTPLVETVDVDAVIDNPSACTLFDVSFSTSTCGDLCLEIKTDCEVECDGIRYGNPEEDDCYMQVEWYPNDEYNIEEIIDECYFSNVETSECCFTPPEFGTYYAQILVQYVLNGENIGEVYEIESEYQDCSSETVTVTDTWTGSTFSPFKRFDLITVNSGATLTITSDLILHFCEGGKLVIKPGGTVLLYGTLTADCEDGWTGVEVQGNGSTNQFPVLGLYPQGRLRTFPGSKIELALTAVRLFGPEYEDTGGMIEADGTKFYNNRCGIYFAPFNNYFVNPGKPRNYFSWVRNCTFDIIDGLPLPVPFIYHINMYKVNGINISGTTFANSRHIEDASDPRAYGIGIKAVDAGFTVGSSASSTDDEPCFDPCINKSTFFGLGMGISVNKAGVNRPFQVFQSEFAQCYFGIVNDGVSGSVVVGNEFKMGAVQTLDGGHEDQVGISYSGLLAGLTIEENYFELTDEITDNSLGIVMNGIGEMDQFVRKNTFVGITIGNEAFGINGIADPNIHQGLRYLCNENIDVQMNDFYLPNDVTIEDYISNVQGEPVIDNVLSAANLFSETGDTDDGDFANYGDNDIEKYYYNTSISLEEPIDYVGINALVFATENLCRSRFCLNPCLNGAGFADEIEDFYSNQLALKFAANEDDFDLVAFYHMQCDGNIFNILRYIEYDTATFNRDTLRAWYYRAGSIAGDLLLAADFFDTGEYTDMNNTIDDIPTRHVLTALQELDIDRVKFTYGALSARTVYGLTSTEIDSLVKFSEGVGAAASLSRSTLAILDTLRTPSYYIPGEINPRSDTRLSHIDLNSNKIKIYPNPIFDILNVEIPGNMGSNIRMELSDVNGRLIITFELRAGKNELNINKTREQIHGIVMYRIFSDTDEIETGKLINLK